MGKTLGILFTISTYGTWLRGDVRGWIDEGKLMPPDPFLELQDEGRLKYAPFRFKREQRFGVGDAIGRSLIERLSAVIWALCVQSWHVHFLTAPLRDHVSEVVKMRERCGALASPRGSSDLVHRIRQTILF